jgi:hypothetical protein
MLRVWGLGAPFTLPAEAQLVFRELVLTRRSWNCTLTVRVGLTPIS